ncbi:hypothetical protein PWT90_06981 [Aphanocladium album]|nr:hypothetical protein PWT90_06981 [Aphanocladium album]
MSSKKGIAYNNVSLANLFRLHCPKCSWAYNWDAVGDERLDSSLMYVPMLWNTAADHVRVWQTRNRDALFVFSFNEPDMSNEANMPAADAAQAHAQYMNNVPAQVLVGAPAISSSSLPFQGANWLKTFLEECRNLNCRIDFCNTHWYSDSDAIEPMFAHLEKVHELCDGKPVWLTEFAVKGSDADVAKFIKEAVPRLESLSYLDAYAYFWVAEGYLCGSPDSLSHIGQVYATL